MGLPDFLRQEVEQKTERARKAHEAWTEQLGAELTALGKVVAAQGEAIRALTRLVKFNERRLPPLEPSDDAEPNNPSS